jgi:hypothetical protein
LLSIRVTLSTTNGYTDLRCSHITYAVLCSTMATLAVVITRQWFERLTIVGIYAMMTALRCLFRRGLRSLPKQ